MADYQKMLDAMAELEEDDILDAAREIMENGGKDAGQCMKACQAGMDIVGKRFETGEYFVGDLVFAGDLMSQVIEIIKPALAEDSRESYGKMILCTVKGDLHDIGKNIVKAMLNAGGFEVVDLGIDVAPETIVEEAKKQNITIVGLSGVLTLAIDSMKDTVDAFRAAGLREQVHIIIGGNPTSADACRLVGADAWAINPQDTVAACRNWSIGA
ncbi:MAG: cobalamin-dependent protein [Oscillospiraceae bacterium]|nr:cobalamin-dependent protein [Oscillospiraceae bacterium]